ncbi:hypothetical protein PBCV1_A590aL [Paramecium bursaria Chlorella virus 1]|uniref:Uncharacterized protein n=1 Tax=Paramecium bursaria Chlorella virus 1 TaxID=10506 RepID=F8TU65_PBCV1|nr:hypothetical protein PBCV1_A590aL [Paramecium bursaria Chlorella virus 1]AEI70126.1 hypothetical protein [Paramecium bursaria Chlorella virus 1]
MINYLGLRSLLRIRLFTAVTVKTIVRTFGVVITIGKYFFVN